MDEFRPRRVAAPDNREVPRPVGWFAERPDRLALWAVVIAVVALVAGAASAKAGSGGLSSVPSGGTASGGGASMGAATIDCEGKERTRQCDEFETFDWTRQRATWYGPGFFGNQTACGQTLTRRTRGVAHKTLPCGTPVMLRYKGRYVRTRVIDRGPYAHGAKWDLTQATARALRFETTDDVSVARPGR